MILLIDNYDSFPITCFTTGRHIQPDMRCPQ